MPLHDPQWGKRGKSPSNPDIDQIWRDLNQKFDKLLGRNGSNDGGQSSHPHGGKIPFGSMGLIGILVLFVWLASGFYMVDQSQRGIVFRFGKHVETTMPGARWHFPYPIEQAEIVNVTNLRTVEVGKGGTKKFTLMLTDDENIVDIQFAVQYQVKDPEDYLFFNRNTEESVVQVAESAMREIIGRTKMDDVLYGARERIPSDVRELMQQTLDRYRSGILIVRVTLQNTQPPEAVQASFDDAVKASQDRDRAKNEGEAYANDVIPRARGNAARLLEEAQGYNQSVVAKAQGDSSRFKQILTEYSKAPQVTRNRLYLDMMQTVLGNTSKVLVDQKNGSNLLYLPLDKLIAQTTGAQGSIETLPPKPPTNYVPESPASVTLDTQRSRENLKVRERESR